MRYVHSIPRNKIERDHRQLSPPVILSRSSPPGAVGYRIFHLATLSFDVTIAASRFNHLLPFLLECFTLQNQWCLFGEDGFCRNSAPHRSSLEVCLDHGDSTLRISTREIDHSDMSVPNIDLHEQKNGFSLEKVHIFKKLRAQLLKQYINSFGQGGTRFGLSYFDISRVISQ